MNELDIKLTLEADLRSKLSALDGEMVSEFSRNSAIPDFRFRASESLSALLLTHSMKTAAKFKQFISDSLPLTVRMSPSEAAEIDVILTTWYQEWTPKQADLILATTQRHAGVAKVIAARIEPDPAKVSGVAVGLFSRGLRTRRPRIAQLQTLASAEIAKHTEAMVLVGTKSPPTKTWHNQGDSRVRDTHAVTREVPVGSPFTIGGEELMFPGDSSLGASMGNIINCRCFVVYDIEGARREP